MLSLSDTMLEEIPHLISSVLQMTLRDVPDTVGRVSVVAGDILYRGLVQIDLLNTFRVFISFVG